MPTSTSLPPTLPPQPTPTLEPTLTATATPPPTATVVPSSTPLPALALLPDGFSVWCNPLEDAGRKPSAQAPEGTNVLIRVDEAATVKVPAEYCVLVYRFNQPTSEGAMAWLYDSSNTAFLKAKLSVDSEHPDVAYAVVKHKYVIDPPFWQITYRVELVNAETALLYSEQVTFARPLPSNCPYGGLPDPVTMKCTLFDPWEVEPRPGVHYPYPTHTPNSQP